MRLVAIVLCALAFAASEARADILELLKTHKIVVGLHCYDQGTKPCTPPPMNPRSEIRLVNNQIFHVSLETKTGFIYALNHEEDVVNHPLMAGFFQRVPLKATYVRTQASVSGQTLVLARKEAYGAIHSAYEERITVSDRSCLAVFYEAQGSAALRPKLRRLCELAPLADAADGPQVQTLSFTRIDQAFAGRHERQTYDFRLVNDRLYYTMYYCSNDQQIALTFDWRGGSAGGTHQCQSSTGRNVTDHTLTYSSAAKLEGNARQITASGVHEQKGFAPSRKSFELDIRFVLDGGRCRIEKFYRRDSYGGSTGPFIQSADDQSECSLN